MIPGANHFCGSHRFFRIKTVVTFGFSAFVKLLSLNDRPQATELRNRLNPTSGGGYDFHKQTRQLVRQFLVEGEPLAVLLAKAAGFSNAAEGRSATAALGQVEAWRSRAGGEITDFGPAIFESPNHLLKVKFEPSFALKVGGRTAPLEIWNTMKPRLADGPTYAALSIAAQAYEANGINLENVGLLSLREPARLYLLTDVPRQTALAASLVERIEGAMRSPFPHQPQPEDRPFA
jgi:hypothetical protein